MQELELSIACVCHWRVVNGSACRGIASPLLVEHIADVQHIEGQLNRMDFLAHLELVGLGEMEVEVTLKRVIVGKTLVVLATMLAQITWKSHATLTLLATQDLPTFGYNMIDPLKSWCWGSI